LGDAGLDEVVDVGGVPRVRELKLRKKSPAWKVPALLMVIKVMVRISIFWPGSTK
jgi:hypothetical protein